jgi:hypothetical protein
MLPDGRLWWVTIPGRAMSLLKCVMTHHRRFAWQWFGAVDPVQLDRDIQ